MRLAPVAAALALAAGLGSADGIADTIATLRADLAREPGSFVGWVPGAYSRAGMCSLPASQLESVPILDVDHLCRGVVGCVQTEQEISDVVKLLWNSLTLNDRNVCIVASSSESQGPNAGAFYKRLQVRAEARIGTARDIERLNLSTSSPDTFLH